MKLVLNAIIAAFLFLPAVNSAGLENIFDGDVQIISSDETGITLTYTVPNAELVTIDGYPEKYKFPQIARTAQVRHEGKPLLPVKVIPIGVPFGSQPTISIISQRFSKLAEVEVPNFVSTLSENEFLARTQTQVPYQGWPSQSVFIESENIIRGLRIIKVNLAAAKIEDGVLYKADSYTIRIAFNNGQARDNNFPRPVGPVFENLLRRIVANYDVAKNWRVHWPPGPVAAEAAASVFDSSQIWVRMEATNPGIYRVSRFGLSNAGVPVDQIDPRELRIFYGGGRELPVDNDVPRPEFREIPIYVTGDEDGVFNEVDQVLFYAESTDRFEYDTLQQRYGYIYNHYTAKNVYWLTYDGDFQGIPSRWGSVDGSPDAPYNYAVDDFSDFIHEEQELIFYWSPSADDPNDHFDWFWGNQTNFTVNFQLVDAVAGAEARIVTKSVGAFDQLMVNNTPAERLSYSGGISVFRSTALRGGTGFNTMILSKPTSFYLDCTDIHYQRWLTVQDNQLRFTSPESAGTIRYRISGVGADYVLLDISDIRNVARIENAAFTSDTLVFHCPNTDQRQFYLFEPSVVRSITGYEMYEADDLRSVNNGADYIIITPSIFYDQSLELAQHRQAVSPGIRTRVVRVEDVYNQFGWGLFDPLAIRDFLKYAYENWGGAPPAYAVLIGDGHYDYRNNMHTGVPNLMPPFESTASSTGRNPWASDESYIYFGQYGYLDSDAINGLDMIIGRLCANSVDEMQIVLNKIRNYEANPTMGTWRNNIILVADDNLSDVSNTEVEHTVQAESLANTYIPNSMEIQKIYMVDYPLRAGGGRPDAREAMIQAVNDGGMILDYIGHGNKGLWAHEQLFRRIEDMPRLRNGDMLPMICAASCSIGFFDHPSEQGMAEDFVRYPAGGGIATISATRVVYSGPNAQLNRELFSQLLFADSTSFGGALYLAKYLRQVGGGPSDNDRKFMIIGDPALVASKPTLEINFSYAPDSLQALTVDSIAGTVRNDSGEEQTNFNGTVWLLVKDASINRHRILTDYFGNPLNRYVDYVLPGPTIFNGPAEVTNGHFSTAFFVPKDVTYGGAKAKIFVYVENGSIDGSGVIDSLTISGGSSPEPDSTGPSIEIFCNGRILDSGVNALASQAILEARLYDPHGINMTGSMGHAIVFEMDEGETHSEDITGKFIFDRGNWQQGSAIFQLPELAEGEYAFSLKAWDNYNNSSLFTGYARIVADDRFAISEIMNYPNPAVRTDSTVFQYLLNGAAEKVSLKIFTLAGRKIKDLELRGPQYTSIGYHYINYNLKDADSDRLASGVYIYKIEAVGSGMDGQRRKTDGQSKLVILR